MPRASNRGTLVEQGTELLRAGGFAATGVQDITRASGVPKGSFYNYFASKDEFGVVVLRRYIDDYCADLDAMLIEAEGAPLERLERLFDSFIDVARASGFKQGCLAGRLCQELADDNPEFRVELDRGFDRVQEYFTQLLFEAQQAGDLSASEDPAEIAAFLYNAWQGALLRMKATADDRPLQQFKRVVFGRILVS